MSTRDVRSVAIFPHLDRWCVATIIVMGVVTSAAIFKVTHHASLALMSTLPMLSAGRVFQYLRSEDMRHALMVTLFGIMAGYAVMLGLLAEF